MFINQIKGGIGIKAQGHSKDKRLYNIWSCMKQRCNNPKHTAAAWYHDKGIRVCDRWNDDFLSFQSWAFESGYSEKLTIDRIDSDGDYCPENCRWITLRENLGRARRPCCKRKKSSDGYYGNRKGKYEVWLINGRLFAVVMGSGLMHSDAVHIRDKLWDEQKPGMGEWYSIKKPKQLHKEGDFFFLENGEEVHYPKG